MAREQRKSVFTLKFESETAENKKKMKIYATLETMLTDSLHQREMQNEGEGKRT